MEQINLLKKENMLLDSTVTTVVARLQNMV